MDNLAKDPTKRAAHARAFGAALAAAARASNVPVADASPVGRLSQPDVDLPGQPARPLDATLDDVAVIQPPSELPGSEPPPATQGRRPPLESTVAQGPAHALSHVPGAAYAGGPAHAQSVPPDSRAAEGAPAPKRSLLPWVLVTLLLVALGVVGTWAVSQRLAIQRDEERITYLARARHALADARYVTPPGENVHELVQEGLKRWPNEPHLLELRSTASGELVMRSMVAQRTGDVSGARELARQATVLDPTDHFAALQWKQCDQAWKTYSADPSAPTGRARVLFDAEPATVPTGQKVSISARLVTGAAGPKAKITGVKATLFEHLNPNEGVPITLAPSGTAAFQAAFIASKVGSYDVVFEATIADATVRAEREITIIAP
jgi:hypothetical protein